MKLSSSAGNKNYELQFEQHVVDICNESSIVRVRIMV